MDPARNPETEPTRPDSPTPATADAAADAPSRRIARRWPLISGAVAVVLAFLLGALILTRGGGRPIEADAEWMEEILEHRSPVWEVPALVMNFLGAGIAGVFVIPIAIVVLLLVLRRPFCHGALRKCTSLRVWPVPPAGACRQRGRAW